VAFRNTRGNSNDTREGTGSAKCTATEREESERVKVQYKEAGRNDNNNRDRYDAAYTKIALGTRNGDGWNNDPTPGPWCQTNLSDQGTLTVDPAEGHSAAS
jgi:hypothetical protein